jgi:hypothetical protein
LERTGIIEKMNQAEKQQIMDKAKGLLKGATVLKIGMDALADFVQKCKSANKK